VIITGIILGFGEYLKENYSAATIYFMLTAKMIHTTSWLAKFIHATSVCYC